MSYASLETIFHKIAVLNQSMYLLSWDQAVMLPTGSSESRGEQLALLQTMRHELLTNPAIKDQLGTARSEALNDWQHKNLYHMERLHKLATAVPSHLLAAQAKAANRSEMAWRDAKKNNDFKSYAPLLQEILQCTRDIGAAKASYLGCSLYDALLEDYNHGLSEADITPVFDDLAGFLPAFIPEVMEKQRASLPHVPAEALMMPVAAQQELARNIAAQLGFDFSRGRLDVSTHPMCGGHAADVRMTNRYDANNFLPAVMGVVHETGHALYEQHRPREWITQPVGSHLGMAMHESQSLFVEMQLGRRHAFGQFLHPLIRASMPSQHPCISVEELYLLQNQVQPGLIRVDADEVTYPVHVILRYRLEKALISGDLPVAELPGAWKEGMQKMLGVVPVTDAEGCLQDIHWPSGYFGYFPSYSLGAIMAAQWFAALEQAVPDVLSYVARGEFAPVMQWLHENLHSQGSRYSTEELLIKVTGRGLDSANYKRYLQEKFLNVDTMAHCA